MAVTRHTRVLRRRRRIEAERERRARLNAIAWPNTPVGLYGVALIRWAAATHFGLTAQDIVKRGGTQRVRYARRMSFALARSLFKLSLTRIGQLFGDRDHSTVYWALDQHRKLMASDPAYSRHFAAIRRVVQGRT